MNAAPVKVPEGWTQREMDQVIQVAEDGEEADRNSRDDRELNEARRR